MLKLICYLCTDLSLSLPLLSLEESKFDFPSQEVLTFGQGDLPVILVSCSLTKTIDAEVEGEMATLKETINDMVYKLRLFSSEVTRVSLDVGTMGQLGGQAVVTGVEGTWKTCKYCPRCCRKPRLTRGTRMFSNGNGQHHGDSINGSDSVRRFFTSLLYALLNFACSTRRSIAIVTSAIARGE